MRVVVILVVLSIGLGVAAYAMKEQARSVSQVLAGFSILFAILLVLAFFNLI